MIKEYNDSTWQGKAYSKIVDTTQQVTSFPVVVRPMENTIPSWTIKGNLAQEGTPSPSNIIYPSETGERTGNFVNPSIIQNGYYGGGDADYSGFFPNDGYRGFALNLNAGTYTLNITCDVSIRLLRVSNSIDGKIQVATDDQPYTFTLTGDATIYVSFRNQTTTNNYPNLKVMLNTGSTALPYRPYGYKLDIKSGLTTTPVYLGEVESTRWIRKLVLDGTENWNEGTFNYYIFIDVSGRGEGIPNSTALSTHTESGVVVNNNGTALFFKKSVFVHSSLADFRTYLQQQYANGTPVTIWYVLATPTTGILNEPLRKIGTYSDSVSGTNLSVTAHSPTTIDVDTTLKPSEMDLTYTGTKMCRRKKYAGLLTDNPLCGIGDYKDTLNLETGTVTRILKKYEFTGQENWICTNSGYFYTGNAFSDYNNTQTLYRKLSSMFSHYIATWNDTNGNSLSNGYACLYCSNSSPNNYHEVYIRDNSYSTANDFKAYLAQQYAAGTPVTVWYVLTTATTETIAVPEGLTGTVEGYLTQSGTPTPTNPIYPTANLVSSWQ